MPINEIFRLKEPPRPLVAAALLFVVGTYVGTYIEVRLWMVLVVLGLYGVSRYKYLALVVVMMVGGSNASLHHSSSGAARGDISYNKVESGARLWVSERIEMLEMNESADGLSRALVLGDREGVGWERTKSYRRGGAAHILAVSGLHIGIVLLVFGALLRPIMLLPWGNIWHSLLVVVLIWCYASMVGGGDSVVRAAVMFSVVMLSQLSLRSYNSINAIAVTVVIMLLVDPSTLFSVGFQLSVTAVLAILIWVLPLWSLMRRLHNSVVAKIVVLPILIGSMCTIATLPIVLHTFGYLSVWGVAINPIILITTYITIATNIVWCVISIIPGVELIAPLFGWLIESSVWIQDSVIGWVSSGWRDAIELKIYDVTLLLIYLCYALVTWFLWGKIGRRKC